MDVQALAVNPFVLTSRLADLLTRSMHVFENDIRSEVDHIWENRKLFARNLLRGDTVLDSVPSTTMESSNLQPLSSFSESAANLSVDASPESVDLNGETTPDSLFDERVFLCVEELVLSHCFQANRFDSFRFIELIGHLKSFKQVGNIFLSSKKDKFLSNLITSVMRKVFVCLSMTRSQIDACSRLVKCVLLLISDNHTSVTQGIHSNYNSCVRDSLGMGEEKDLFLVDCFERCNCFSLALDTGLFGQEHIMTCTVRFVFETKILQFPLFMSLCYASSGEEMADFLMAKLMEKNATFSKLMSLTTDGASNMTGNERGLFVAFCRLLKCRGILNAELADSVCSVWCFAHRLNLVTRDMKEDPVMSDVFCLADWITSRRVAVSYRKFLKTRFPDMRFRKIPTPSETRWLFYRDAINAILSQFDQIDIFASQNDEYPPFKLSQIDCDGVVQSKECLSFQIPCSEIVFFWAGIFLTFWAVKILGCRKCIHCSLNSGLVFAF